MALLQTPLCQFGLAAPPFHLKNVDESFYSLEKTKGHNATLVMFICNHCPYVCSIIDSLVTTTKQLQKQGIGIVAIMPNDTLTYVEDSFDNMKSFAQKHHFFFPYLIDETQSVAKDYGAVCTPDFFGYNQHLQLQYRGRFASNESPDLFNAMVSIAKGEQGPSKQYPSMGCSIKWRHPS